MAYWEFDSIKPIRRKQFIQERGIAFLAGMFVCWALFCLYFAVLPNSILQPELLLTEKFWAYVFLTGCYAFAILSWITFMSCLSAAHVIIANFIVLGLLLLFQFALVPLYSMNILFINSALSIGAGAVLLKIAYYGWCKKEFA